jgi:hypothetical protein
MGICSTKNVKHMLNYETRELKNENRKMIVQMECWFGKNVWRWNEIEVWKILVL